MFDQMRKELRKFGETTTMKGVSRTIKAESLVARTFWLIALLVCFSMLLFQIITVVINYCSYSSSRNFLVLQSTPDFPAVTICNMFPASNLESYNSEYKAYMEKLSFLREQAPDDIKTNDDLWSILEMLMNYYVNVPLLYDLETNPTALESMIVRCNEYGWDLFGSLGCPHNLSSVRPLQLCRTVTTQRDTAAAIQAIIYLDNTVPLLMNTFFNWIRLSLSTGVSVMLHQRGQEPDPATAIYAQPGTSLTINVQQNNITRLLDPYGNCSSRTLLYPDQEEDINSPPYGQETCISLCRQHQFIKACGCLDASEFFTAIELQMTNYTFCLNITKHLEDSPKYIVNNTMTNRFWNLLNCSWQLIPDEDLCDCPTPCSETYYEFTSSSAQWPNVHYQLAFYDNYLRNDSRYDGKFSVYEKLWNFSKTSLNVSKVIDQLQQLKLVEQNFVQVTVKMQKKRVTSVTKIGSPRAVISSPFSI